MPDEQSVPRVLEVQKFIGARGLEVVTVADGSFAIRSDCSC